MRINRHNLIQVCVIEPCVYDKHKNTLNKARKGKGINLVCNARITGDLD